MVLFNNEIYIKQDTVHCMYVAIGAKYIPTNYTSSGDSISGYNR